MARTEQRVVREWLSALGSLVADTANRAENERRLTVYLPLLSDEFPLEAFTQASLVAVGRQCRWFPTFGELCSHLSGWYREQRPPVQTAPALEAPPEPKREPPTEEEKAVVREMVESCIRAINANANADTTQRSRAFAPVSDPVLLAIYERAAVAGDINAAIRASCLRAKLGAAA